MLFEIFPIRFVDIFVTVNRSQKNQFENQFGDFDPLEHQKVDWVRSNWLRSSKEFVFGTFFFVVVWNMEEPIASGRLDLTEQIGKRIGSNCCNFQGSFGGLVDGTRDISDAARIGANVLAGRRWASLGVAGRRSSLAAAIYFGGVWPLAKRWATRHFSDVLLFCKRRIRCCLLHYIDHVSVFKNGFPFVSSISIVRINPQFN